MESPPKPTSTESSLEERRLMVRLHREGQPYAAIAARVGVSVWTVGRWVRAARRAGPAGLAYRGRRPGTPHPLTSPPAVQARIAAVRAAHPGWGARLVRRQLAAEGVAPLPSERTVHAWLRRQGAGPVRPPRGKPLGWATAAPASATPLAVGGRLQAKRGAWWLSVVTGPRGGPCLWSGPVPGERTGVVLAALAALMRARGEQPAVVQTDRGPCFVGAEGGERRAVPGRLTLWLWGLGVAHRVLPPAKPWRNGAVERWHGALEHSWAGEADGVEALRAAWNAGKPAGVGRPYQGRGGFDLARVWAGLATVRVERRVDPQGKLSLWDRPLRPGRQWAGRAVLVTFDAAAREVVLRDRRERRLAELPLPWLTTAWIWAGVGDAAPHPSDPAGTPTFR